MGQGPNFQSRSAAPLSDRSPAASQPLSKSRRWSIDLFHKRFLLPTLTVLCAALSHGQDLTSRQAAMQSLQTMLSRQDQVSWVQAPSKSDNSAQATHVTATLTDVTVDVSACRLLFKDGRVFPDQHYQSVQTWKLRIPEIDQIRVESLEGFVERFRAERGQPSWATKTSPRFLCCRCLRRPARGSRSTAGARTVRMRQLNGTSASPWHLLSSRKRLLRGRRQRRSKGRRSYALNKITIGVIWPDS